MSSRIASMFLMLLTIGFFALHFWWKNNQEPSFVQTIQPGPFSEDKIALNEFLMLMDEYDEGRLQEVLDEFDLEILAPLGEWVHVIKRASQKNQHIVALNSQLAEENLKFSQALEAHDAVHSVELNYIENTEAALGCTDGEANQPSDARIITPSDPFFRFQWYLSKETGVDLPGAWAITTGSEATVIAIVDRNFDFSEDDLDIDRCKSRRYYYENILDYFPERAPYTRALGGKHGSQVLSVIAPCTDNSVGLSGIDWRAQIFAVDTKDNASFSARMFGILWAAGIDVCTKSIAGCPINSSFQRNLHPANVINTSFGFAGDFLLTPPYGPVLDIISRINRQGRIIVASAGNEGQIADRRLPGAAGGVISVGASNSLRRSSTFSNIGRTVDVVAPGEKIVGIRKGQPTSMNGTSFSSPIVAGIASLMLAANPLLSWKHVEYILKATASPMPCKDYCSPGIERITEADCRRYCCKDDKNICASGIVNAAAAVKMASLGFPNRALADIDDYFLALSDDNNLQTKLIIKNWGKKKGLMRMRMTDRNLKMWPSSVMVSPIQDDGVPGMTEATVFYDNLPKNELEVSLIIEAADADNPSVFHDQIEAIVSIVPDPEHLSQKHLKKALHKR